VPLEEKILHLGRKQKKINRINQINQIKLIKLIKLIRQIRVRKRKVEKEIRIKVIKEIKVKVIKAVKMLRKNLLKNNPRNRNLNQMMLKNKTLILTYLVDLYLALQSIYED
jgi:hypothetical protein